MPTAIILDTETTALISNSVLTLKRQPQIVEFNGFLVDTDTREKTAELDFTCNPGIKLPEEVVRITGLKDDDLADKPPFSHYAQQVIDIIQAADWVVAHNLSYDKFVIETELKRLGLHVVWRPRMICTVESTEWIKGFRLNLSALHEHLFGEPFKGAHRARQDVEALTRCFFKLLDDEVI